MSVEQKPLATDDQIPWWLPPHTWTNVPHVSHSKISPPSTHTLLSSSLFVQFHTACWVHWWWGAWTWLGEYQSSSIQYEGNGTGNMARYPRWLFWGLELEMYNTVRWVTFLCRMFLTSDHLYRPTHTSKTSWGHKGIHGARQGIKRAWGLHRNADDHRMAKGN